MQVSSEISGRNRDANQPDDDSDPKKPNLFNVNEEEEDNKSDNYSNRVYTIDDDSYVSDTDKYCMTTEEALRQQQEVLATGGFDIDPLCRYWMSSGISPAILEGETLVTCTACANLALDSYNEDKNTNFEFVELEKANWALTAYIEYYITFKARDGNAGTLKTFQAHVAVPCERGRKVEVDLCRLKPGEEDASASTKVK